MTGHGLCHRSPATIVGIAAVAIAAIPIPVFRTPLFGDFGTGGLVMIDHALDIIALGAGMQRAYEIDFLHGALLALNKTGVIFIQRQMFDQGQVFFITNAMMPTHD